MAAPFAEFAGNRRLMWIAQEWASHSEALAEWAMERLVNRRDVWSQYTLRDGQIRVVMLPIKERRAAGTDMVTLNKLQRHFAGKSPAHLIGLHSISDHSTCKWFAIDVDLHDESVPNAGEIAAANFDACIEWAGQLRATGMDPLLLDSNGVGGYHIWVFLDKEYPLADVYDFADEIRSTWNVMGLPRKPEIFPPKREVAPDDLPYTLRTPGRHHTRHFYTRVWNFEAIDEIEWLEGSDAIEAILAVVPSKLPRKRAASAGRSKTLKEAPAPKRPVKKRKPRVCVDLDGVLAKYDGWKGLDHIGDPIEGAVDFAKKLDKFAEIVIFTSRCSTEMIEASSSKATIGKLRVRIIDWLEANKIPYSDVYVGQGKPRAGAFIDDRGINCNPQADADAFTKALSLTRSLVKKPHGMPEAEPAKKATKKKR
jgi:hypothetical protein